MQNSGCMIESQNDPRTERASGLDIPTQALLAKLWLSRAACATLGMCLCECVCVRARTGPPCCAPFGQESSASFSVPRHTCRMCKEAENISACVSPKEEGSAQVLISSIFRKDLFL